MTKRPDRLIDRIGQFATVPHSVIEMWTSLGTDAVAMFLYLRYRSGGNDVCFPSYDLMSRDTGMRRERISNALAALEVNGLLEREHRFSNSTIYILKLPSSRPVQVTPPAPPPPEELPSSISPTGGLMDETPLVRQSDYISPSVGLPLVRQGDTNKIQLTRVIEQDKNEGAGAPEGSGSPPPGNSFPARRTDAKKKGDFLDALIAAEPNRPALDVSYFPEDCQPVISAVCKTWHLLPPARSPKGEFPLWITDARQLNDALGEFGLDALPAIEEEWIRLKRFSVGRPGALVKTARAVAGTLRSQAESENDPASRRAPLSEADLAFQAALRADVQKG